MQLLDDVNGLRADEKSIGPEHLNAARSALMQEIAGAKAAVRRRPGLRLGLGLGLGGIGVATAGGFAIAAIVASSVVAPVAVPEAAAAEVFEQASQAVLSQIGAEDAQLAPGQYLRIETTQDQLTTDGFAQDRPAETGAFRRRSVSVLYVPADRSDDWIQEVKADEITGVYGPGGQEFLDTVMGERGNMNEASVRAFPAGIQTFGDLKQPFDMYRDDYDEMPRDPAALLDWFAVRNPDGVGLAILNALYQNLPPADIRAALLGALARVPGFTLVSRDGDLATIERSNSESTQQFVIDTRTGEIVRVIDPMTHPTDIVPKDIPEGVTTFTTSVVDAAPSVTG